jgi:hypothetical protein
MCLVSGFAILQLLWHQIFILDFAYISQMVPREPRLFSLKMKKYLHRHPVDWNIHFL